MIFKKASGVLLHPTSLPGKYGIGDFGKEAYNFVDLLAQANQKLWQVLPLNFTGFGNSPYNPLSAFAGNPLLISLEKLKAEGYLSDADISDSNLPEFKTNKVEFEKVMKSKNSILKLAFSQFKIEKSQDEKIRFAKFCKKNRYWLGGFALFAALRNYYNKISWNKWDKEIVLRKKNAIEKWKNKLANKISFHKFVQYKFAQQWLELKSYANNKNIKIIGDIPIFVSYDSSDVWENQDLFFLDKNGVPTIIAGVPPDYFSKTGQLWGNPLYNWERMLKDDFKWWQKRLTHILSLVDYIRIDHFGGFVRYWAVPAKEKTALNGKWERGPGEKFFYLMEKSLGKLPIIAEDLGEVVNYEVNALKEKFGFPGMKILQFAFGEDDKPPHKYEVNNVVYTGTHDNDTILGWFKYLKNCEKKIYRRVKKYLNFDRQDICWDMIKLAFSTPSHWAIIPLQDILCLNSNARMNLPGTTEGNWEWRYKEDMLTPDIAEKLAKLTTKTKR